MSIIGKLERLLEGEKRKRRGRKRKHHGRRRRTKSGRFAKR